MKRIKNPDDLVPILVRLSVREGLRALKVVPRESYSDAIARLIAQRGGT